MTTATDELVYTDEWAGISSAVNEALYDADTKTFYITLDGGATYSYDNVDVATWDSFTKAWSKGRFYAQTIKGNFGPGTYLGYEALKEATERSYVAPATTFTTVNNFTTQTVGTPKDLKYAEGVKVTNETRTFSLAADEAPTNAAFTTTFTVGNSDEVKSVTLAAYDIPDAVESVLSVAEALGLDFTLKSVTVVE